MNGPCSSSPDVTWKRGRTWVTLGMSDRFRLSELNSCVVISDRAVDFNRRFLQRSPLSLGGWVGG